MLYDHTTTTEGTGNDPKSKNGTDPAQVTENLHKLYLSYRTKVIVKSNIFNNLMKLYINFDFSTRIPTIEAKNITSEEMK